LIAPTPSKRQTPEGINRLPFLIARRQDNGPTNERDGCALLFRERQELHRKLRPALLGNRKSFWLAHDQVP
jgi:hypothetical protein